MWTRCMGSSISGEALCYSNTGAQALSEGNYNRATRSSWLCSTFNQDPRGRLKIKTDRWFIGIACVVCAGLQLPASSLHRVIGTASGLPLSWQRALEILRSKTKLSSLSCHFLSLSNFLLNHCHNGLRKQGRKTVKRAFHYPDRGKNAWFYQIFQYRVNTVISSFSVNIFSFKFS